MLSIKNPYILDAANTMFQLCENSKIRKICQDREDYNFDIRSYQRGIQERDDQIKELIQEKNTALAEKDAALAEIARLKDLLATTQK